MNYNLDEMRKRYIKFAVSRFSKAEAARRLGITRNTLDSYIKKYEI